MVFILFGAILGTLAVVLGAVLSHLLADTLTPRDLELFTLANHFNFYHALALIAIGTITTRYTHFLLNLSGWLMTAGVILFSGSLYVLALTQTATLGFVPPLGGGALIVGWIMLACAAVALIKQR